MASVVKTLKTLKSLANLWQRYTTPQKLSRDDDRSVVDTEHGHWSGTDSRKVFNFQFLFQYFWHRYLSRSSFFAGHWVAKGFGALPYTSPAVEASGQEEKVIQHQLRALMMSAVESQENGCSVVKCFWLHLRSLDSSTDLRQISLSLAMMILKRSLAIFHYPLSNI